jgi:type VI secretion system VgrG family protein
VRLRLLGQVATLGGVIDPSKSRAGVGRLQPVRVELWCPQGPEIHWHVLSVRGSEALSQPYEFELELACDDPLADAEAMLGADAELLFDRNGQTRAFYGVLVEVEVEVEIGGLAASRGPGLFDALRARARLVPAFTLLEQEVDTRFFAGQTVVEILRARLGEALAQFGRELDVETRLGGSYDARDYCVQFRESTFAFCSRIMEEEGIAYMFVPDPETQRERMVLVDDNAGYEAAELLVPGGMPLASHQSEELDRESIQRLDWRSRKTPNRVVTRGYNLKHPARLDEGEAEALDRHNPSVRAQHLDADRRQIIDDPVGDPQAQRFTGAELRQRSSQAARLLQRHELEAAVGHGTGNAIGFAAGTVFELDEVPSATGGEHEFLLVRVVHHAKLGEGEDAVDHHYANRFECIPRSRPYRPALRTPRPRVYGVQTGVVVGRPGDEVYTDALGRVKVRFHRDRHAADDEHASCWIRVAQVWAGPGYGAMVLPRVGMEVVVAFVDGNPDCPLVTGCVYDGANAPPHALPAELSRSTFKSSSTPGGEGSHELRMEDAAGTEQLFVHAQRRMDVRVRGALYETCTGNREEVIGTGPPGQDARGDHNTFVHCDNNTHIQGGKYQFVLTEDHQISNRRHEAYYRQLTQASDLLQLNSKQLIVETGEHISLKSDTLVLAGSTDISVKAGAKLILDSNNKIELRVGTSFISIGPEGIDIQGPKLRLNSGGFVGEAGEGERAIAYEILHPLEAYAADDGRGGGRGGGGGGGGKRERYTHEVEPIQAPPMKPPAKLPRHLLDEVGEGSRNILNIAWQDAEVWCSQSTPLWGSLDAEGPSQVELVRLVSAADGSELGQELLELGTGRGFERWLTVNNVIPRADSQGRREPSHGVLATIASARTAVPIQLRFLAELPTLRFGKDWWGFDVRVENHQIVLGGTIEYTRGWLHYVIDLTGVVDPETGGRIGGRFDGHSNWWYCKKSRAGGAEGLVFWDGEAWRPVPKTFNDDLGTKLLGNGVWVEKGVTKVQMGQLAWPDAVPEWSAAALTGKDDRLAEIAEDIEAGWSGTFELERDQCRSEDPRCCRYSIRCEVDFVEVAAKRRGIILAENDSRANAGAWPYDVDVQTAQHEFGHRLGNPDEYPGATSVDPSVNGDGAVVGIDKEGLMGEGWELRRRYWDSICEAFTKLVQRETGTSFTYSIVPELDA